MSFRSRFRLVALLATAVLVPLTAGGIALAAHVTHVRAKHHRSHARTFHGKRPLLSAAQVKRLSAQADKRSIIIFKDQLGRLPATRSNTSARVRAALASQVSVRAELSQLHATHVRSFSLINAMAATVSAAEVKHLQANPAVQAVVPDALRHFASLGSGPGPALGAMAGVSSHATSTGTQQTCTTDPSKPIIEPEAREVMNVDAAEQLTDGGSGVKVGILADGIDPNNPDLIRANGQHVIFDYQDFSGFGPTRPDRRPRGVPGRGHDRLAGQPDLRPVRVRQPGAPAAARLQHQDRGHRPRRQPGRAEPAGPGAGFFNSTDHRRRSSGP